MAGELEAAVADHYEVSELESRLVAALEAAGVDLSDIKPQDLAPVDEFHIGGRPATVHAISKLSLTPDHHVLDVGCGIGGAARYIVSEIGCRVTGIDLTPSYIEAARAFATRTGLQERLKFEVASALDMPFDDGEFDAAVTFHVAMNIKDREGLYREIARVLKLGAEFCIYDVMKGENEGLIYPVPWAETEQTSHVTSPDEMLALLDAAGFDVVDTQDRTEFGIAFFKERLAAVAEGQPAVGLHLLMGRTSKPKFENVLRNLEAGHVAPVLMLARRRG